MLYYILSKFQSSFSALNIFSYLSFRSIVAFIFSFTLVLIFQPLFINWFVRRRIGQPIRDDGPQAHLLKQGTPTMGGLVVVVSIAMSSILLADLWNLYVWLTLGVLSSYGTLGFVDDYKKIISKDSKGVGAMYKLLWQFGTGALAASIIVFCKPEFSTAMPIPFFKDVSIDLGWFFIPFVALIITGTSNAVNLTDGLDGLAIGPIMTVAFTYGVMTYTAGNVEIAEYLQIPYIAGSGDLAIIAASIIAGGLGFLWFNSYPAQIFMGDVGSLALGGALGMMAVASRQELLLLLAGGVFVVEAFSVIVQVVSFKATGKRIFKMAPLHHHFELKGWAEPKIIVRCWIISIVLALLSIATLKIR